MILIFSDLRSFRNYFKENFNLDAEQIVRKRLNYHFKTLIEIVSDKLKTTLLCRVFYTGGNLKSSRKTKLKRNKLFPYCTEKVIKKFVRIKSLDLRTILGSAILEGKNDHCQT